MNIAIWKIITCILGVPSAKKESTTRNDPTIIAVLVLNKDKSTQIWIQTIYIMMSFGKNLFWRMIVFPLKIMKEKTLKLIIIITLNITEKELFDPIILQTKPPLILTSALSVIKHIIYHYFR